MKKRVSVLLIFALFLSLLTGCSGGKLDFSWFTSKFTGKTADQTQAEQEAAAAEETRGMLEACLYQKMLHTHAVGALKKAREVLTVDSELCGNRFNPNFPHIIGGDIVRRKLFIFRRFLRVGENFGKQLEQLGDDK